MNVEISISRSFIAMPTDSPLTAKLMFLFLIFLGHLTHIISVRAPCHTFGRHLAPLKPGWTPNILLAELNVRLPRKSGSIKPHKYVDSRNLALKFTRWKILWTKVEPNILMLLYSNYASLRLFCLRWLNWSHMFRVTLADSNVKDRYISNYASEQNVGFTSDPTRANDLDMQRKKWK